MAFASYPNGDILNPLDMTWFGTTALKAVVTALGSGELPQYNIKISTANSMEIDLMGDSAIPEGRIMVPRADDLMTWRFTVRFHGYVDVEGNYHWGQPSLFEFTYNTTAPSLGQEIQSDGTAGLYVKGVNSGGIGKVVHIDTTLKKVYVLI